MRVRNIVFQLNLKHKQNKDTSVQDILEDRKNKRLYIGLNSVLYALVLGFVFIQKHLLLINLYYFIFLSIFKILQTSN